MENFSDKIKLMVGVVEKFVENNFIEKDQRDENFRKLALAFELFVKENPLRSNFSRLASSMVNSDAGQLSKQNIRVKKLDNFKGELPKYQSDLASGFDVRAQLNEVLTVSPGQRVLISTGLAFAIPRGFEIQARPRSGFAIRDGITVLNTPGTIDADYRGEIKIILINLGENTITINDQDRIAQLVLGPVLQAHFELVDNLDVTDRGAGGFGSTGKN